MSCILCSMKLRSRMATWQATMAPDFKSRPLVFAAPRITRAEIGHDSGDGGIP